VIKAFVRMLVALIVIGLVVGAAGLWWISRHQFSARATPNRLEAFAAQRLRRLAMGSTARDRTNPVPQSPAAIRDGLEHFADHCAVCHANNGSGNTEMGRGLYPKVPDMRLAATQQLTDGELFYVIENGVRFTGMPAWSTGTDDGEQASWHLVHFIRHLPQATADELAAMERLNPRSPEAMDQEKEREKFLEGDDGPAPPKPPSHKHPGGTR
jgi:mono/diheme cytochrome c family protein